jgi:hypothetical protein
MIVQMENKLDLIFCCNICMSCCLHVSLIPVNGYNLPFACLKGVIANIKLRILKAPNLVGEKIISSLL